MKKMPNVWIDSLLTYDDTVKQISKCLSTLKHNAEKSNLSVIKNKSQYSNDVMYMKQFFERAEFLIRNGDYEKKKKTRSKKS